MGNLSGSLKAGPRGGQKGASSQEEKEDVETFEPLLASFCVHPQGIEHLSVCIGSEVHTEACCGSSSTSKVRGFL